MKELYDLGVLKNDPVQLYNMAINFQQFFGEIRPPWAVGEIWDVLEKVNNSLWVNLPPVITIDFRDPDDPNTWGDFGSAADLHSEAGSARNTTP